MIRINLMPFRLARKKENIRRQVSIFLLSLVFIILALVWAFTWMNKKTTRVQNQVAQVKAESLKYQKTADKVTQINEKLGILEDKLAIVKTLEEKKREQQILLEQLADQLIPEKMWLTRVSADDQHVSIKGVAFDNPTIAAFMRNLENWATFREVNLNLSKTKGFDGNIRLKEFEISCEKIVPEPEPDEADKGKKSRKRKK